MKSAASAVVCLDVQDVAVNARASAGGSFPPLSARADSCAGDQKRLSIRTHAFGSVRPDRCDYGIGSFLVRYPAVVLIC